MRTLIKFIGGWALGMLIFKIFWMPFVRSCGVDGVSQIHAVLWPILVFTIVWSAIIGSSISAEAETSRRDSVMAKRFRGDN